jgi:ParB-like chromosome segregation protein Spo0J
VLIKQTIPIKDIYVPSKRRKTLNPKTVEEVAQSILEIGQQAPIMVREDDERFVLVEGCIDSKLARCSARKRS